MASSSTTRQEVDDADSSNGSDDESVNLLENLVLDVKVPGRVALTRPVENDDELFSFAAFRGVLSELHPDILLDCKRAFTATTVDDAADAEAAENGISSGETYWVSAVRHESEEVARCGLEHLATEIFDFHVRRLGLKSGINFDPARSGAEWWTQYIEGDAEIGFHFDKDFTAEEETGLDIFPHLATVTYLTAGLGAQNKQAPTIILDHSIGPPKPVDEADNAGVGFPSPYASSGTGVRRAWLSSPSPGKHICFNGRHLHGAADVLARCFSGQEGGGGGGSSSSVEGPKSKRQKTPSSASSSSDSAESPPRVTFLVNLWFNWKPLGCDPLPDTAVAAMTLGSKGNKVCFQNPDQAQLPTFDWPSMKKVDGRTDKDNKKGKKSKGKQKARKEELSEDETADEAQTVMRRHFNQRGRKHVLELPLPRGIPTDDDDDDSSSDDESEEDAVGGAELPWALEAGESAELVFLESSVRVVCLEESGDEDDGGEESSEDDEESEEDDGPDDLKKVALIECMIESVSGATGSKRKRARRKAAALISECHFDEATVECCRTAAGQATNAIKNGGGAAEDGSAVQNDDTSGEDEEDNNGSERGGADGQVGFEDVD